VRELVGDTLRRRAAGLVVAAMLLAGTAGGLGARWTLAPRGAEAQSDTVTAGTVVTRALRVVDNSNRTRIFGGTVDSLGGAPALTLTDADGKLRALLGVSQAGRPFLSLNDANHEPRMEVTTDAEGRPAIFLHNERGQLRATLRTLDDGRTGLAFFDDAETVRVVLEVGPDGRPGLYAFDRDGRPLDPAAAADLAGAWPSAGLPDVALQGTGADLRAALTALQATAESR
jgi:hypothetical protein